MKTNPLFRTLFALVLTTFFTTRTTAQEWKPLGPWGGRVDALAGDTNLLIASFFDYGGGVPFPTTLYCSRNSGLTWEILPSFIRKGNSAQGIRCFEGKIFAVSNSGESHVSVDTGRTFQSYAISAEGPVCRTTSGYYFGRNPAFRSTDGINYIQIQNTIYPYGIIGAVGDKLYGYKSNDSLFTSIDQGESWQYLSSGLDVDCISSVLAYPTQFLFSFSPSILFMRNPVCSGIGPLVKSVNGGITWSLIADGLPSSSTYSSPYTYTESQVLFTANSSGIFRSDDMGESWVGVASPINGSQITSLYSRRNRIFVGTIESGIFMSDDLGENWSESLHGFQQGSFYSLAANGSHFFTINEINKPSLSADGGGNWERQSALGFSPVNPYTHGILTPSVYYKNDTLLANTFPGGGTYPAKYSTDHGATFQDADALNSPVGSIQQGIWMYNNVLYKYSKIGTDPWNILRSTNFGARWDTVHLNTAEPGYNYMVFNGDGNSLYILNYSQSTTWKCLRSLNNGLNWTEFTLPGVFSADTYVRDLAVRGDTLYAITTNNDKPVLRSYNQGQNWANLNQAGGAGTATRSRILQRNGVLFLASGNGVFRSTNRANGWSPLKGNYPFPESTNILDMIIKGDSLIVSVANYGLWHTPLCQGQASVVNTSPCAGGNVQLTSSGGTAYSWTGPNNFNSTLQNPLIQNIQTAGSGTYTVTVTTPGGCSLQRTVTITVQPGAGTLALTASTVCAGQNLSLGVTGGTGTYQWTGPGGFSSTLQNPVRDSVTAADSGTYTVTVTAGNGCTSTKSIYVAVPYLPRANMKPVENRNPCAMDTVWLEPAFLPSGVQYQWYRNNVAIAGATNATYGATTDGTYHFLYRKGVCQSAFFDDVLLTFSGFRQPRRPVLTITPPPSGCLEQFTIQSTATGSYGRKWHKNGVEISGATAASYSTNELATYRLRVDTTGDCVSWSAPVTVQLEGTPPFVAPQIDAATVRLLPGNSMRCAVEWKRNDPLSSLVQHVVILRQSDTQAGQYDSVGVASNTDTAWVDLTADPVMRPYFYKLQARAVCSPGVTYLSAPSSHHKTIHLQISQPPMGNLYNLLWTGYEGFAVSSYKIYRGLDFINTSLLTTVAGNITSYTDAPPTTDTYFYRVEAETNDAYFPWGRIAAFAVRTTKSNTRPSTQSIIGGDSTSIYDVTDVAERIVTRGSFTLYPSPSPSGMCMLKSGNAISEVTILDALGRNIPISILKESETLWSIRMERPATGLYLVKVKDTTALTTLKWVVGE